MSETRKRAAAYFAAERVSRMDDVDLTGFVGFLGEDAALRLFRALTPWIQAAAARENAPSEAPTLRDVFPEGWFSGKKSDTTEEP